MQLCVNGSTSFELANETNEPLTGTIPLMNGLLQLS